MDVTLLAAMLMLILLLGAADFWLNRRRRLHEQHARERVAAHMRRLQREWDVRPE